MLVITRKEGEAIIIADDIEIKILGIKKNAVRFGINAPKHIIVHHTHPKVSPAPAPAPEEPITVVEQKTEAGVSR